MFRILLVAVALTTPSSVYAACANYTDGSMKAPAPKVTLCVLGKCEKTTLEYSCGNVHGAQVGYANGWRVEIVAPREGQSEAEQDVKVYKILRHEDYDKITCKSADHDACVGFPLPSPH